ncbi:hypothetical protein K458DRAFT_490714 [Lentithecium fluviatile CBS 122367]|uniref:2EXR domain-containing protein n=1 Tax=Lentithecium fluviatile CBS 122367 TaxID=1168545 RepID=A0A6G1IM63_9PLEO|nr:hypothetical protein K458DRAFT_490714 [Lentithecium fluviatile CBS 122367]
MSAQPNIPILNSRPPIGNPTFHPFTRLPKELRLLVWRHALHRHRIIKLHLSDPDLEDPTTFKDRMMALDDSLKNPSDDIARYRITIDGAQSLSKLLHVCRESREATLMYYRVHIPCRFMHANSSDIGSNLICATGDTLLGKAKGGVDAATKPGTFYFNPDWDFLQITCWPETSLLLPPFLYHLKTQYDPRGVGVLNIVVDFGSKHFNIDNISPACMSREIAASFEQTFRQLQQVFFYKGLPIAARIHLGMCMGGYSDEVWFNRSLPISAEIPAFDLISLDPRPISKDLRRQFLSGRGNSSFFDYHRFTNMLSRFSISPADISTQFKFMIAMKLGTDDIRSRVDAEKALKKDWERWWLDRSGLPTHAKEVLADEDYAMGVETAFGFWLFPLEAMGAKANVGQFEDTFDMTRALNYIKEKPDALCLMFECKPDISFSFTVPIFQHNVQQSTRNAYTKHPTAPTKTRHKR